MAVVPRVGRGAAAIGCLLLAGAAGAFAAQPVPAPTRTPIALGHPAQMPACLAVPFSTVAQPFVDAGAISDVVFTKLGERLGSVTSIANAGDARLFLTLRGGRVVIWNGTRRLHGSFLKLSDRVSGGGAQGLLSLAFDPNYASNGIFYVLYTDKSGNLVLARYRRSATKKNRADRKSGVALLKISFPSGADHYGGGMQFGPDGYLYVGIGDGGSADKPTNNAQRDDVLLGKILRLDVSAGALGAPLYRIPPSNPFVGQDLALPEIWAKGLCDPWRLSFDRGTGDLYIGDVGRGVPQEIDFQLASSLGGENYGWPSMAANSAGLGRPILIYSNPNTCAVVGGYVYRGTRDPRLEGAYFYGEYCTGFVWGRGQLTNVVAPKLTTFGEDVAGELYAATESGVLYRLTSTFPPPPGFEAAREPRPMIDEPPPPPFEIHFKSEPEPWTPPVGTFVPPQFEPPFALPVYVPVSDAPPPEEAALEEPAPGDQTPLDQPEPQPSPSPPPGQNSNPDRQPPAPPPQRPPPRVVEPRR